LVLKHEEHSLRQILTISRLVISEFASKSSLQWFLATRGWLVLGAVFLAPSICSTVHARAPIQEQIDALPAVGGEIRLGCGVYTEPVLVLRDDVAIVGAGPCTVIPSLRASGTNTTPKVRIRLENFIIDGALDGRKNVGVDFQDVRLARINNLQIRNVKYGIVLSSSSLYNSITDAVIDADVMCFAIIDRGEKLSNGQPDPSDHPNENVIRDGKCQNSFAPARTGDSIGLWIRGADDVKIFGTSFENLDIGIKIDSEAVGTVIFAPRLENMNVGIWLKLGSSRTVVFQPYQSNIPTLQSKESSSHNIKIDRGVTEADYLYYGF
jgi:hypothetical protein